MVRLALALMLGLWLGYKLIFRFYGLGYDLSFNIYDLVFDVRVLVFWDLYLGFSVRVKDRLGIRFVLGIRLWLGPPVFRFYASGL